LQRGEPVLPALGGGGVGADVLEQQQLSGGAEHACDLAGGVGQVGDAAQHEGADEGVGAVIGQWELFGGAGQHLGAGAQPGVEAVQLADEAAAHVGFGLDEHEPLDLLGAVVRQVGAGAGADLDHDACGGAEQLGAVPADDSAFGGGGQRVVGRGEQSAGEPTEPAAPLVSGGHRGPVPAALLPVLADSRPLGAG
jgi:hypothetical protein